MYVINLKFVDYLGFFWSIYRG